MSSCGSCETNVTQFEPRYKDISSTVRYIYRTEGLAGFRKGILPRMSINVPATAISWGTYELIKGFLVGDST